MVEEEIKADWNMAMAYYIRIDKLLSMCADYALSENGRGWYKTLLRLYMEAKPKFVESEKKECDSQLPVLAQIINNMPKQKNINIDLYSALYKFESDIRMYMETHGMLIPNKEGATHGF